MVAHFIPVPGLREAIKKERFLRDSAFLETNELLLGLEVRPLSLRRMIWLEQAQNGFVCDWQWERDDELIGHAIALLYFSTPAFKLPGIGRSFLRMWIDAVKEHRFRIRILMLHPAEEIVRAVDDWVSDSLMDAPAGEVKEGTVRPRSFASWPAYIFDKFGEAGLTFTADEVLDMPLKRLWQHYRIAIARLNDAKLQNPSDAIAAEHVAKVTGPGK